MIAEFLNRHDWIVVALMVVGLIAVVFAATTIIMVWWVYVVWLAGMLH